MELVVLLAAIPVLTVLGVLLVVGLLWVEMRRLKLADSPSIGTSNGMDDLPVK